MKGTGAKRNVCPGSCVSTGAKFPVAPVESAPMRIVREARSTKRSGVRQSVCPTIPPQQRRAASLLLRAVWAGDIDRQRLAPSSGNGASARHSAANAGSAMLIADG